MEIETEMNELLTVLAEPCQFVVTKIEYCSEDKSWNIRAIKRCHLKKEGAKNESDK